MSYDCLPPKGGRIIILGGHPWSGSTAVVIEHEYVGLVTKKLLARVRLEREDAMDRHECFVGNGQWKMERRV